MQGCPSLGAEQSSGGDNQYSCYRCEYDLCYSCMTRVRENTTKLCYLCGVRVQLNIWNNGWHRYVVCNQRSLGKMIGARIVPQKRMCEEEP